MSKKKQKELDDQLLDAAASGAFVKVRQLIDSGASVMARDEETQWTPLHLACYFDYTKICNVLLKQGASSNARARDGSTPLIIAAGLASIEVVQLLLNAQAQVNLTDAKGYSALMMAADRPDQDITELLISYEANATIKCNSGMTAMDMARDRGALALAAEIEGTVLSTAIDSPPKKIHRMKV